jgi:16S rRNA (cytidine1402-2'-O)-methyltransferase
LVIVCVTASSAPQSVGKSALEPPACPARPVRRAAGAGALSGGDADRQPARHHPAGPGRAGGCDVLLAEDTRVSGKLLAAYAISKRLQRYDEHVADRETPRILERLEAGERIALVSDAGTPMVSDPGLRLAQAAIAAGHQVFPIPGASAALAALTLAGLPTDRFLFAGFPPTKTAARKTFFEDLANVRATLIFYEGASRVADSLADMAAVFGPRPARWPAS